jgi:hypothetical protein
MFVTLPGCIRRIYGTERGNIRNGTLGGKGLPSVPFDCFVRLFERRSRHAAANDATEASAAWRQQRRVYRDLLKLKRQSFCQSKLVAEST